MANYFTQFSCLLPVGSAANLEAALAIYQAYAVERAEADEPLGLIAEPYPSRDKPDDNKVWLHADDDGEPEDVLEYAFRCAETLGLSGVWGFRWSLTCSRPLLDGYGGGAHVVDLSNRQTIAWIDLEHWLVDQARAYHPAQTGIAATLNVAAGKPRAALSPEHVS
jgi:hypothetical protein